MADGWWYMPMQRRKKLIENAYQEGEAMGLAIWVEDEVGPYQAIPQAGQGWCETGRPVCQPHEYVRGDTAKLFTLFHPPTGELRAKGMTSSTNRVLHPWLESELATVLATLPEPNSRIHPAHHRASCLGRSTSGVLRTNHPGFRGDGTGLEPMPYAVCVGWEA
jgi:hypothetical protein